MMATTAALIVLAFFVACGWVGAKLGRFVLNNSTAEQRSNLGRTIRRRNGAILRWYGLKR